MTGRLISLFLLLLLSATLRAQPTVPPGYTSTQLAAGVSAIGGPFAVDDEGNAFISQVPSLFSTPLTRIDPQGSVLPAWISVLGVVGQLARHPLNGRVHVLHEVLLGPTFVMRVSRIEPSGQLTVLDSLVAVSGRGLAIDNQGAIFIGSPGGIFRRAPGGSGFTFWHPGSGQNSVLLAQVDGSVLVGDGFNVKRIDPTGGTMTQHFGLFIGNQISTCSSLARSGGNALGSGVIMGYQAFVTLCGCSSIQVPAADLSGAALPFFATLPLGPGNIQDGWIAGGPGQQIYLYAQGSLHVIDPFPQANLAGNLILAVFGPPPVSYTLDLYGNGPGAFLLAADIPGTALPIPPFGISATSLGLAPTFIAVVDGLGLFTPPDPQGLLDVTGHKGFSFGAPSPPLGLSLQLQAYIPDSNAPNGLFFLSNVIPLTL